MKGLFLSFCVFMVALSSQWCEGTHTTSPLTSSSPCTSMEGSSSFSSFTGRVTGNKVRLRQDPDLECRIIREMDNDELLIIVGEVESFYSVKPPATIRAYVYRSYVIDDVIEGSHVNVRLQPDIDAPVITQLNTGDRIQGSLCVSSPKWMEITIPDSVCFYVAKEYIERVGDADYLATMRRRTADAQELLNRAFTSSQEELHKSFEDIDIKGALATFDTIITEYSDLPEQVAQAQELEKLVQETYVQKKNAYLESKASSGTTSQKEYLEQALESYYARLSALEAKLQETSTVDNNDTIDTEVIDSQEDIITSVETVVMSSTRSDWDAVEETFFWGWAGDDDTASFEDFYAEQKGGAVTLKGIVETYGHPVKHKPGDYLLLDSHTHVPVAYLYSTRVSLGDVIGQEVSITGIPRPNNNFAYPAYYALSMECP